MVGIMGPIGGGKTTTSFHKLLRIARAIPPSRDGISRVKFPVLRDTIRNLNRTTLKTWQRIVSPKVGRFVGASGSEPGFHEFRLYPELGDDEPSRMVRQLGRGVVNMQGRQCRVVDVRMEFFAVGEHDVEALMRGIEGTAAFVNEGDLMPEDLFTFLPDRLGRYPERDDFNRDALDRAFGYGQTIFDFNAPTPDNFLYKKCFEEKPDGLKVFVQPGGRDPDAENIQNLKKGYYSEKVSGRPDWYVRRFIDNQPAFGRGGSVVFPEYNDRRHCAASPIKPVPGLPIYVGLDAGYNPAATIWQRVVQQWRGLAELYAAHMGPNGFGDALNALLTRDYAGYDIYGVADPAACVGDPDIEESAFADIVSRKTGVRFKAAPTNTLAPRLDAVRLVLTRMIDGVTPAFQISPAMVQTRAAYNGRYIYEKKKGNEAQEEPKPAKPHPWSDLMDTNQYVFCRFGDYAEVQNRVQRSGARRSVTKAQVKFNVFARA